MSPSYLCIPAVFMRCGLPVEKRRLLWSWYVSYADWNYAVTKQPKVESMKGLSICISFRTQNYRSAFSWVCDNLKRHQCPWRPRFSGKIDRLGCKIQQTGNGIRIITLYVDIVSAVRVQLVRGIFLTFLVEICFSTIDKLSTVIKGLDPSLNGKVDK